METPDSEGYVNVIWPSRNVPHGGIFHTRTAETSTDRQQFLKVLLDESKFSLKLRQNHGFGLRSDESARRPGAAAAVTTALNSASARPRTSHRRSLSAIRSSGILDIDTYRPPKKGEDRERMKERLANTMAYGDSPEQAPPAPVTLQRPKKPAPKLPTAKETWNDLVTQIRERSEWLAEMEWLGEAGPHREIVQGQIAERMRALDALGVDSTCSSVRSSVRSSAHSTMRSSPESQVRTSASPKGEVPKKVKHTTSARQSRRRTQEEDVTAYNQLSPLGYSPRRRV